MSERKTSKFEVSPVPIRSLSATQSEDETMCSSPNSAPTVNHPDGIGVNGFVTINVNDNGDTQEVQFSSLSKEGKRMCVIKYSMSLFCCFVL